MEEIVVKDWFDKHVVVMNLDNDRKKQKQIKDVIKKTIIKKLLKSKRKVNNG